MPLQFTDKFFDEDPGLIKLTDVSQDFVHKQLGMWNDEYYKMNKENENVNREEILRKASELTRAIDSQYELGKETERQQFASIFNSPMPHPNL